MAPMARQVAREVIVTLEPVVDRHNETLVSDIHKVTSTDREKEVPEASSIHIDLGFSAPYLDLPLLRSGIPSKSLTPRIQWDFTPGESFTLPPLIKTIECSCKL